jgi:hypothetical protein
MASWIQEVWLDLIADKANPKSLIHAPFVHTGFLLAQEGIENGLVKLDGWSGEPGISDLNYTNSLVSNSKKLAMRRLGIRKTRWPGGRVGWMALGQHLHFPVLGSPERAEKTFGDVLGRPFFFGLLGRRCVWWLACFCEWWMSWGGLENVKNKSSL